MTGLETCRHFFSSFRLDDPVSAQKKADPQMRSAFSRFASTNLGLTGQGQDFLRLLGLVLQ